MSASLGEEAVSSGSQPLSKVRPLSSPDMRPLVIDREDDNGSSMLARARRSLLAPLTLRHEVVLSSVASRAGYHLVHMLIRVLPFLVLYGGTLALVVCVLLRYRWGVLMSMMLYSFFMLLSGLELVIGGAWGMLLVWMHARNDWYDMYCKDILGDQRSPKHRRSDSSPLSFGNDSGSGGDTSPKFGERCMPVSSSEWAQEGPREIVWHDVFHVVMMPTYKTPMDVLHMSVAPLLKFSLARTNLAICFAFEEREAESRAKFEQLKQDYADEFAFVTASFHPPNLPGHVPGKSSNECWAFMEISKELKSVYGFEPEDPRVVITVIDDDSEVHENYFEAVTYHYLSTILSERHLTIWQAPIVHFKNFMTQPGLVRLAAIFASLHELAALANPLDCHIPFSSYSLSLMLATAVGGWDPDFISEDWHMLAKTTMMTEGRCQCKPIFLPLMNYAPEEETTWGTIKSRWTQATRHALGISEIVYVVMNTYVGMIECGSLWRALVFLYRMLPVICKFVIVHFTVATLAFWPLLSHILINVYMWHSWCYIEDLEDTCASCCVPMAAATDIGVGQERVILNSWMVFFQERANLCFCVSLLIAGGWGAFYFHLVRDRADGDWTSSWVVANPFTLWLRTIMESVVFGWFSSAFFGSIPEWMAAARVVVTLQFTHVVAGMVGRSDKEENGGGDGDL
eukprot:TRINITY_DN36854_c0_g1_i1.p1 TRINITY_DN36854_c0_g1~~TRINITY_DN36854_c0_g1_i1.p1  ORF type:complete len:683 (+),score=108.48 TRINITY_DN36854_c0_g1_i1:53-2101(+)